MKHNLTIELNAPKVGVGLRPTHFPYLEMPNCQVQIDFFEAVSENFMNTRGRPFRILKKLRQDYPIALHGVSLSIAGNEAVDVEYIKKLKILMREIDPFLVSDHLCWTGLPAHNLHNLLPFPYTEESLQYVSRKVLKTQDLLGRPLILENASAYFSLSTSTMSEVEFLNELCRATDCHVLMDLNNIYVNSVNQGFNPYEYLDKLHLSNVRQIHLAGYSDMGDYLFDTHSRPVFPQVWDLFHYVWPKLLQVAPASLFPVLMEWDEDIPEFHVLQAEALKAKKMGLALARPRGGSL